MRWFVLLAGLLVIGGFTVRGYATMVWLAYIAVDPPTSAQTELLQTAR